MLPAKAADIATQPAPPAMRHRLRRRRRFRHAAGYAAAVFAITMPRRHYAEAYAAIFMSQHFRHSAARHFRRAAAAAAAGQRSARDHAEIS